MTRRSLCALGFLFACAESGAPPATELLTDASLGAVDGSVDAPGTGEDASEPELRCVTRVFPARGAPLELLVLLDSSFSMQQEGKLNSAALGIVNFADNPHPTEVAIGMNIVPTPLVADHCLQSNYRYPLVPVQSLETFGLHVRNTVERYTVGYSENPFGPALAGGLEYMTARAKEEPSRAHAMVLVTDGMSESCGSTLEGLSYIARAGAALPEPLESHVVAFLDDDQAKHELVAAAGGGGHAHLIPTGSEAASGITTELVKVRDAILRCQLRLPELENTAANADTVRLLIKAGDAQGEVAAWTEITADECALGMEGFRFDSAQDPARIRVCPAACSRLRDDPTLQVQVEVGCLWSLE